MALGEYYDEALLAQKVYGNLKIYNNDAITPKKLQDNENFATVTIPASNGNAAYEYRVINVHENTETGYYGVAFQKYVNGVARDDIVISHRGTNDVPGGGVTKDSDHANLYIATDGELGNFDQLNDALSFYNSVASNVNEFSSIKQVEFADGTSITGDQLEIVSNTGTIYNDYFGGSNQADSIDALADDVIDGNENDILLLNGIRKMLN